MAQFVDPVEVHSTWVWVLVAPIGIARSAPTAKGKTMRVMIIATTGPDSDSTPTPPSADGMQAINRFHEELAAAGVLIDAGRLQPSSKGARVRFKGSTRHVTDGPFLEAKELVGGYWIWQVGSMQEAIEWLKRAPFDAGTFEIREIAQQPS
jgi:hypothetical protein